MAGAERSGSACRKEALGYILEMEVKNSPARPGSPPSAQGSSPRSPVCRNRSLEKQTLPPPRPLPQGQRLSRKKGQCCREGRKRPSGPEGAERGEGCPGEGPAMQTGTVERTPPPNALSLRTGSPSSCPQRAALECPEGVHDRLDPQSPRPPWATAPSHPQTARLSPLCCPQAAAMTVRAAGPSCRQRRPPGSPGWCCTRGLGRLGWAPRPPLWSRWKPTRRPRRRRRGRACQVSRRPGRRGRR